MTSAAKAEETSPPLHRTQDVRYGTLHCRQAVTTVQFPPSYQTNYRYLQSSHGIPSTKPTIRTRPMNLGVSGRIRTYDTRPPYAKLLAAERAWLGGFGAACLNECCQS
ncbi:hypothetical protein AFLA_011622 [Aspergillus flavus NRRL3357]|nr:hypothetical protein AFLA_011622 [Aspergillus flavus NRRL3357]